MEKSFGWCFIGCGTLAKKVASEILRSPNHTIVSVYGRNAERTAVFAKKYGAKACSSAEEAISSAGVDAVYVVTPHTSHYEYAKQALNLGRPVLCEKPMTVSAWQTAELIELAKAKNLYLAEAMWTWFSPVANHVKTWVHSGEFGDITRFQFICHTESRGYAPRVTDPSVAGGALLDMGVYPLTYMYHLFGKPASVTCTGIIENGIDWEEDVTFHYPGNISRSTSISIRDLWGGEKLIIEGTKARTAVTPFHYASRVKLHRKDGTTEKVTGACDYRNEFDIVSQEIREGKTESSYEPLEVTLAVMEIMDECRRQMGLVYPFEKE